MNAVRITAVALSLLLAGGCAEIGGALPEVTEAGTRSGEPCPGGAGQCDDPEDLIALVPATQLRAPGPGSDPVLDRLAGILLESASYQLNVWWPQSGYAGAGERFSIPPTEDSVRPITAVASGLAIALGTGAYDPGVVGVSREEAMRVAETLLRSVSAAHVSNGGSWGDGWQTALWASSTGLAAWILWDELDRETRRLVTRMVLREADNFIGYQVPYHRDPAGRVLSPGDTKAEESSWNSRVLSLALAMYGPHSNAPAWREKKIELQLSSYASEADLYDPTPIHGRPLCRWLGGFNALSSGYLVNHRRLHPGYMRTPHHAADALHGLLAGRSVDLAAVVNLDRTYRALVDVSFSSPPHLAPGGAAYRPGSADLYFPHADDWGGNGYVQFVLHDVQADALGFDGAASRPASGWIEPRLSRVEAQMARFDDGRVYADGESRSPMAEQDALEKIAEAYLTRILVSERELRFENAAVASGGAAGCPVRDPDLAFCPSSALKRSHMAAFLMRLRYGGEFVPRPAEGLFSDVDPRSLFAGYIEQLARDGVTAGCRVGEFCPDQLVRRDQAATFLVRYRYGAGYQPPAAQGIFEDVPASSIHARSIEKLYRDGVIRGCAAGRFCPSAALTRGQMATLLMRIERGGDYQPPAPRGVFEDVPTNYVHAPAIEYLYDEEITLGCR